MTQKPQQSSRISSNSTISYRQSLTSLNGHKESPKSSPVTHHPLSTWNFRFNDDCIPPIQVKSAPNIVAIPFTTQERLLITELLYTLIGINGNLITPKSVTTTVDSRESYDGSTKKYQVVEFEINAQVQNSFKDILMEILPLANYYFQIQKFVEDSRSFESGQVLQALGAALRKLINDYYVS